MKILHAPTNVAGQPYVISRAQRRLGHKSDVLVHTTTIYNYPYDINIDYDNPKKLIKLFKEFIKATFTYDIFHFYYNSGFIPRYIRIKNTIIDTHHIDVILLKILRKKIIFQFVGSDVIQKDLALKYEIFTEEQFTKIYPDHDDIKRKDELKYIYKISDETIVIDHYLQALSPRSKLVELLINIEEFPFVGCKRTSQSVRILHAPTNQDIKGTSNIIEAINKLKSDGYNIEFILVEKMKNKDAIEMYKTADIIIDDINQGPYGLLAMECMTLGKPVLGRINPNFIQYYKDCPIVNTSKHNIYENLKSLIDDPERCIELGILGRKYIKKRHDSNNIAQQIINIYKNA